MTSASAQTGQAGRLLRREPLPSCFLWPCPRAAFHGHQGLQKAAAAAADVVDPGRSSSSSSFFPEQSPSVGSRWCWCRRRERGPPPPPSTVERGISSLICSALEMGGPWKCLMWAQVETWMDVYSVIFTSVTRFWYLLRVHICVNWIAIIQNQSHCYILTLKPWKIFMVHKILRANRGY